MVACPQPTTARQRDASSVQAPYLQWTTMGPEKGGLMDLTFLRNFNMPMGENGTPKSGQLVKWSWVTGLGDLAASLACWTQTGKKKKNHNIHKCRENQQNSKEPETKGALVGALTYWIQNFRMV